VTSSTTFSTTSVEELVLTTADDDAVLVDATAPALEPLLISLALFFLAAEPSFFLLTVIAAHGAHTLDHC
jgi:hypothetical protein